MPKIHLDKTLSSNQNDSSIVIISPTVKRRVKTVQISTNLKKETIKYHRIFITNLFRKYFEENMCLWANHKILNQIK